MIVKMLKLLLDFILFFIGSICVIGLVVILYMSYGVSHPTEILALNAFLGGFNLFWYLTKYHDGVKIFFERRRAINQLKLLAKLAEKTYFAEKTQQRKTSASPLV